MHVYLGWLMENTGFPIPQASSMRLPLYLPYRTSVKIKWLQGKCDRITLLLKILQWFPIALRKKINKILQTPVPPYYLNLLSYLAPPLFYKFLACIKYPPATGSLHMFSLLNAYLTFHHRDLSSSG